MAHSDPRVKKDILTLLDLYGKNHKVVQGTTMADLAARMVPAQSVVQFKCALGSLAFKDRKIVVIHQNPESVSSGQRMFIVRRA